MAKAERDPFGDVAIYCRCHNFLLPILHRNSILRRIVEGSKRFGLPLKIPAGIFFACPVCAAVYACRFDDLLGKAPQKDLVQNLRDSRYGILPIRALGVCGTQNCCTQVEIHTAVGVGASKAELNRLAARWDLGSAVCPGCLRFLRDCLNRNFSFEGFDLAQ